jgi:hypothetical protein
VSNAEARASHAKRLLDDPVLQEALQKVRDEALKAWETTAARDTEGREWAWLTVKNVDRIKVALESMVDDGKIAAARVQAPRR